MARPDDDDALRWDGDDDPTLTPSGVAQSAPRAASAPSPAAPAKAPLPEGFAAVGKGSDEVETVDAAGDPVATGPAPMGNVMLVTVGVLGGVYALWTIGWIVGGLRLRTVAEVLVDPVAYTVAMWLAVATPAIWFFVTSWLTARSRTWVRLVLLIAGAALLVPWPFVMVGAVGS